MARTRDIHIYLHDSYFNGHVPSLLDDQEVQDEAPTFKSGQIVKWNGKDAKIIHMFSSGHAAVDCDGKQFYAPLDQLKPGTGDSAFSSLEHKLEKGGMSAKEAGGIAYKEGEKKYGKKGMAEKAAAGRKH